MKNKQTLIKQDDLYWNEEEGKYVVISDEEIDKVLMALYGDGITPQDVDTAMKAVKWAEEAKINYFILQGVLSGRIRMYIQDSDKNVVFYEDDSLPLETETEE